MRIYIFALCAHMRNSDTSVNSYNPLKGSINQTERYDIQPASRIMRKAALRALINVFSVESLTQSRFTPYVATSVSN